MTLDEFYDTFLSLQAPMNMLQYFKGKEGYQEQRIINPIKQNNGNESYELHMIVPVLGVPFLKQTRVTKSILIDRSIRYNTLNKYLFNIVKR